MNNPPSIEQDLKAQQPVSRLSRIDNFIMALPGDVKLAAGAALVMGAGVIMKDLLQTPPGESPTAIEPLFLWVTSGFAQWLMGVTTAFGIGVRTMIYGEYTVVTLAALACSALTSWALYTGQFRWPDMLFIWF